MAYNQTNNNNNIQYGSADSGAFAVPPAPQYGSADSGAFAVPPAPQPVLTQQHQHAQAPVLTQQHQHAQAMAQHMADQQEPLIKRANGSQGQSSAKSVGLGGGGNKKFPLWAIIACAAVGVLVLVSGVCCAMGMCSPKKSDKDSSPASSGGNPDGSNSDGGSSDPSAPVDEVSQKEKEGKDAFKKQMEGAGPKFNDELKAKTESYESKFTEIFKKFEDTDGANSEKGGEDTDALLAQYVAEFKAERRNLTEAQIQVMDRAMQIAGIYFVVMKHNLNQNAGEGASQDDIEQYDGYKISPAELTTFFKRAAPAAVPAARSGSSSLRAPARSQDEGNVAEGDLDVDWSAFAQVLLAKNTQKGLDSGGAAAAAAVAGAGDAARNAGAMMGDWFGPSNAKEEAGATTPAAPKPAPAAGASGASSGKPSTPRGSDAKSGDSSILMKFLLFLLKLMKEFIKGFADIYDTVAPLIETLINMTASFCGAAAGAACGAAEAACCQ